MNMSKNVILIISVASILFVAGIVQFLFPQIALSPTQTTYQPPLEEVKPVAPQEEKTTSVTPVAKPTQTSFAIVQGDAITSWDFKGAYMGNLELMAKAQNEIERLSGQLVTATSSAMILSVSIANQYELIGDGKKAYEYLKRAIMADVNVTSGLPWHNLGVLMERLGAFKTARVAYEKSTLIQPELKQWHYAYLEFLTTRMKGDTAGIAKAFAEALKYVPNDTDILQLRSEWQRP